MTDRGIEIGRDDEFVSLRRHLESQVMLEAVKRLVDLSAATAGLLLFLPLLPFIAALVKLESKICAPLVPAV